jgi:hypothetical protein
MMTIHLHRKFASEENEHTFEVEGDGPETLPDIYRWDNRLFIYFCQRGKDTYIYRERNFKDAPND